VYAHLGWREIGGQWFYLHAGGAIGTVGPLPDVQVSLSPHLQLYCLPEPPTGPDLADAVRASLRLLEVAGDRVTLPIYCSIWRVVLEGSDSGLHLVGQTGSGKTELAALAQQHYGPGMDSRHLPGSWLSTDNALETLAFLAKDALLVVDDFCPGGDQYKVQSMHAKADRLFRAQGNAAGRGRLRFDGTLRPVKPPRGLILSTGEDVPRGQSLRAWMLVVEVPKVGEDAVDWDRLSECQRDAAAGLYARAMAGFIRWLAPSTGTSRQWLRGEIDALRAHAYQGGQHRRTADIAANLALGFRHFLAFAQAVGAVDQAQAEALWRRCWTALGKAAATQAEDQLDSDPAQRFLDLLAAAISSGRAHLSNGSGRAPEQATARGWKESEIGAGEYTRTELRPQGEHIGWLDQMNIYLQADAAYAVVQRLARDEGDHLSVTLATLKKRLKERGLLASTEKRTVEGREVERLEVHRTLQGKRRAVLHLNAISLAYPPTESAPSVPNAPQHRKSYLLKDGNGAQIGNPSQKVHHESALENGPAVSEDGDAGALGALGTQIARGEGESHRKNPGRDPWDQFLEEATEP
jgi:hypothetical protein